MGAFCVYGVTIEGCKKMAEKKVKVYDKTLERNLTMDEYNERVAKLAQEIFTKARPKQVAPALDAPQFANDWIEIAKRTTQGRSFQIMAKGQKSDKKGHPMVKKGKPVIGWLPYTL